MSFVLGDLSRTPQLYQGLKRLCGRILAVCGMVRCLLQITRHHIHAISPAVGTAAMSPKGASWGVVDPDLKVKGMLTACPVPASISSTDHFQEPRDCESWMLQ
jgi:hypothetical protein